MGVHVLGCCFLAWWVCYVGARGMCGGWCGVARRCSGKCVVWRGCGVWSLAGGRLGLWFRPRVRFRLWLVVGTELVCAVWGFWGWCWCSGGVWCGAGVLRCCCCAGGLRCPMSLGSASWCVAMSRAGLSSEVRVGGVGECGVVWWRWVVCWLPHSGGGGSIVSGSGRVGGRSWFVLERCGAVPCGLLVVPLVFASPWAVWDRCGKGLGVPCSGVSGIGVSQPGGGGRVVPGCVGPPLSGSRGVGSAVYGPGAGCHVCGVWVCGGPGSAPVGGERLCVAGVYRSHGGGGGGLGSGVGWVCGRLLAGSRSRGLTLGGSSLVSPWCVRWQPLVGCLWRAFAVYRIHGGTPVCWRAAVGDAGGCGGVACVCVVRVV